MKIGIVGAENGHTTGFAKVLNVDKSIRGARVTQVWGETRALARKAAAAGAIPQIVGAPEDLIGHVDGANLANTLTRVGPDHRLMAIALL